MDPILLAKVSRLSPQVYRGRTRYGQVDLEIRSGVTKIGVANPFHIERADENNPGRVWAHDSWTTASAYADALSDFGYDSWTVMQPDTIPGNRGIHASIGVYVFAVNDGVYRAAYRADAAYAAEDWTQVQAFASGGTLGLQGQPFLEFWADGVLLASEYGSPSGGPSLYRSDDYGSTWSTVLKPPTFRHSHGIYRDPYNDTHAYTVFGDVQKFLWRTTDRGETWEQISDNFPVVGLTFTPNFVIGGSDQAGSGPILALTRETWQEVALVAGDPFHDTATTWFVNYDAENDLTYAATTGDGDAIKQTLWLLTEWGGMPVPIAEGSVANGTAQILLHENAVLWWDKKVARRKTYRVTTK